MRPMGTVVRRHGDDLTLRRHGRPETVGARSFQSTSEREVFSGRHSARQEASTSFGALGGRRQNQSIAPKASAS